MMIPTTTSFPVLSPTVTAPSTTSLLPKSLVTAPITSNVVYSKETILCAPGDEFCTGPTVQMVAREVVPGEDTAVPATTDELLTIPAFCADGSQVPFGQPCPDGSAGHVMEICWDRTNRPAGTCPPQPTTTRPSSNGLLVAGAAAGAGLLLFFAWRRRKRSE